MEFLSSTYQAVKLGVAGMGGAMSAALLTTGIVSGEPLSIVMGSVWLAGSIFNLGDSTAANRRLRAAVRNLKLLSESLEREAEEFRRENEALKQTVTSLNTTADRIVQENAKLMSVIEDGKSQLERLNDLRSRYSEIFRQGEVTAKESTRAAQDISEGNASLRLAIEDLESSIGDLDTLRMQYKEQNSELIKANEAYSERIDQLQIQLGRVEKLYCSSKEILKLLIDSSDAANEDLAKTADELDAIRQKYQDTLDGMAALEDGLRESTFDQMDANNDGMVSESEFRQWAERARGRRSPP